MDDADTDAAPFNNKYIKRIKNTEHSHTCFWEMVMLFDVFFFQRGEAVMG